MNVYFVRHGESIGNLNKTHQSGDVLLSDKGVDQAMRLAIRLKDKDISVIYASPHSRTKHTAEIIAKELDLPIEFIDSLVERRRPSEVEGLSYDDPKAAEISKITIENQTKPDWKYSDDESYNDLLNRAGKIEQLILKSSDEENILCVSHVGIIIMIAMHLILQDKLTPEVFWQFYHHAKYTNTGITQIEYSEKSGWILATWNDTTHL